MVSHLTDRGRAEGGAAVELSQLRGSHALAQLSDAAIGIQKDPEGPIQTHGYSKAEEYTGQIGEAGTLAYDRETG